MLTGFQGLQGAWSLDLQPLLMKTGLAGAEMGCKRDPAAPRVALRMDGPGSCQLHLRISSWERLSVPEKV